MIPTLGSLAPNLPLAVTAVVWLMLVELAKTVRWWSLIGAGRPRFAACLRALVAGQMTNQLSPVRAGDAVRIGLFVAQGGGLVPGTAAMAAAKTMDAICLTTIGALVAGSAALGQSRLALAGAALVIAACAWLVLAGDRVRGPIGVLERLPGVRKLRLASLIDVGQALRQPRVLGAVLATTAMVWTCGMAANWAVLAAVGIAPTVDLAARMIVLGYLVGVLPAPPVRLGVVEAGVAAALTSGGVPLADAVAAGIVFHACQLVELGVLVVASLALVRRSKLAS